MDENQCGKYFVNSDGMLANRDTGRPIPPEEPVFILRAKDKNAVHALNVYREICGDDYHRALVSDRIFAFLNFSASYPERMKEPDTE